MSVEDSFRQLTEVVNRIVSESGARENFNSERWLAEWLQKPNPALGGKLPYEMLGDSDGLEHVRCLLLRMQSGAYC